MTVADDRRRDYRVLGALQLTFAALFITVWLVKENTLHHASWWLVYAYSFAGMGVLVLVWGWALEAKS